MKNKIWGLISGLLAVFLATSVILAAASLIFDRGLPIDNINLSADADSSNDGQQSNFIYWGL